MPPVAENHGETSPLSRIKGLFGRRDDPYAGADLPRARHLGGILWSVSVVFAVLLLPLSPPTDALGSAGWVVAGALFVVGIAGSWWQLRHSDTVTGNQLIALSYWALANTAAMEWLAGGRDTPWHSFYLVAVVFTACVHPPRRVAPFIGAFLVATSGTAFHSGGWSSAELGEVALGTFLITALGLIGMVLMDGVRAQRVELAQEGEDARRLAHVDELTGIPNRRRLMADLDNRIRNVNDKHAFALAIYDLDGFKLYNDSFGHPAGDALLQRLAEKLDETVRAAGASAYRMGGDEFCVLACAQRRDEAQTLIQSARDALSEKGEGFGIGASYGWTIVTDPALTPSDILRAADRAMYARKSLSRSSPGRQTTDVLLSALAERSADLGEHVADVRNLCDAVADELGLSPEQKAPMLQAASLHDIGKVAIPDAILDKPAPLNEEEWDFMRTHTIIGERILASAPALAEAARLVRASHERFDGWGYPDSLIGDDIPPGARIIAVCDAYDAMISPRPYRTAVTPDEAVAELRRCAGSQFDPRVVEAFCRVYAERVREGQLTPV